MLIDVENDDYIILCSVGGHIMNGFAVMEGMGTWRSSGSKKRLVLLGLSVLKSGCL